MTGPHDEPTARPGPPGARPPSPRPLNVARLWAGGVATAVVATLIALVGVLVVRVVLRIAGYASSGASGFGGSSTVAVCVAAAVGALVATGLAHVLIITTPRPLTYLLDRWAGDSGGGRRAARDRGVTSTRVGAGRGPPCSRYDDRHLGHHRGTGVPPAVPLPPRRVRVAPACVVSTCHRYGRSSSSSKESTTPYSKVHEATSLACRQTDKLRKTRNTRDHAGLPSAAKQQVRRRKPSFGHPQPGDRPARAGHRCPRLAEAGSGGNPPVLRPGP